MKTLFKTLIMLNLVLLTSCDLTYNQYDVDKKSGNNGSGQDVVDTPELNPEDPVSCELKDRLEPAVNAKLSILNAEYYRKTKYNRKITSYLDPEMSTIIRESFLVDQIDVEPRRYDEGVLHLEGESIIDPRNNDELNEYYSISYNGYIRGISESYSGTYQIGILSDDGVILNIGGENLISRINAQAPRFNCASETIEVTAGELLELELHYFQGPRTNVANTLMWRKINDPSELDTSACDHYKNDLNYLESTGWEVIPADVLAHEAKTTCD